MMSCSKYGRSLRAILGLLGIVATLTVARPAAAEVLTFEDLYFGVPVEGLIPSNYHRFAWSSTADFETTGVSAAFFGEPNSGFETGKFGNVALLVPAAASFSSGCVFDFTSACITSAWDSTESVTVQGFLSNVMIYTTTFSVTDTGPDCHTFNFLGVDKVVFIPGVGVHDPNLHIGANWLIVDNITVDRFTAPLEALQQMQDAGAISTTAATIIRGELQSAQAGFNVCYNLTCSLCLVQSAERANRPGAATLSATLEAQIRCLLAAFGC